MMLKTIAQKGSALVTYLTFGLISAGVTGYYVSQGKVIDQNSERIASLSQQVEQVQAAQLSCFNDLRRWCTPGELPAYVPGNLNTLNGAITFNQVGDDLRFTVATSSDREASILSNMLVAGTSSASITTSTIRPPTDAQVFSERLQRYTNATDAARTQMNVDLDMGNNRIDNIQNLVVENIVSEEIVARELETSRTIVNSELDIGGNRIVSNSGNIDIFSDQVNTSNNLNVVGDLTLQNSNVTNINTLTAKSGVIDNVVSQAITADTGDINRLDVDITTATNTIANTADFDDLDSDDIVFNNANGQQLTVNSLVASETVSGNVLNSVEGVINTFNTSSLSSTNANIGSLNTQQTDTVTLDTQRMDAAFGNITNTSADTLSFNTLTASNFVADVATMQNLTVNNDLEVSGITTVNDSINARLFIGDDQVIIDDARIDDGRFGNATVANIDIDDNNATLTNFRVTDIELDQVNADAASIVNVWVQNNLDAERIVSDLATTRLLSVDDATIGVGSFGTMDVNNATTLELYARNLLVSNNASFNSMSAGALNVDYAEIDSFNINNTLTVNQITADAYIADNFVGDNFYAAGDFFSSNSSVNSNANNLSDLFNDLDNCINVTGYCLEKEPDYLISCINCTQTLPQMYFQSRIEVDVQECLQGCTLSFNLDGMDNISGCGDVTLPAGFTGVRSCRVGSNVPTASTVTFNPVVTMANSRRTQFSSAATTTIRYTNTIPRNPQFALACSNCSQSAAQSSFQSTISITVNQCAEGCSLTFNIGSLNAISGCGPRTFSAGYTGTVTCRVSRNVTAGNTFSGNVEATLSNALFGDSSSLSTSVVYENTTVTDNPPEFTLACTGCSQASEGGNYTVRLTVNVTDCEQGCSVLWDVSDFDSSSGCNSRTLSAGYTSSFTCRVTKFVGEQSVFNSKPSVTLTNLVTSQSVTRSRNVRLENTSGGITPSRIRDSITGYTFQYRNSRFTTTTQQNDPVITRTRSDFDLFALEGSFWDASLHIGGRSRVSFTNISFGSGTVCDAGACEVQFVSASQTSPSGSYNGSVGAQIYSCSQRGRTGTEIYYATFQGDINKNPSSICEVNVTIRVNHTDSGVALLQTIPLRPLVSF